MRDRDGAARGGGSDFHSPLTASACCSAARLRGPGGRRRTASCAQPRQQAARVALRAARLPARGARSPHQALRVLAHHHGALQTRRGRGGGGRAARAPRSARAACRTRASTAAARTPAAGRHQQCGAMRGAAAHARRQDAVGTGACALAQPSVPAQRRGLPQREDGSHRGVEDVQGHYGHPQVAGGARAPREPTGQRDLRRLHEALHGGQLRRSGNCTAAPYQCCMLYAHSIKISVNASCIIN